MNIARGAEALRRYVFLAALPLGLLVGAFACSKPSRNESATSAPPPSASSPRPDSTDPGAGPSGRDLYQPCLLCHSTQEMQRGPILNGLPAWYVEKQLRKFRDGVRGANPDNRSAVLMAGTMSQLLDDGDIPRVARHIAELPPVPHLQTVRGDVDRGGRLFLLLCAPCHGEEAQGNPTVMAPPLIVQEDWYLLDQLRKFKAGLRGEHPRDTEGQTMAAIVATLDDAQLRDVVAYLNRAHRPPGIAFGEAGAKD